MQLTKSLRWLLAGAMALALDVSVSCAPKKPAPPMIPPEHIIELLQAQSEAQPYIAQVDARVRIVQNDCGKDFVPVWGPDKKLACQPPPAQAPAAPASVPVPSKPETKK